MMFMTPMPPTSRPIELSTTITSAGYEGELAELVDHLFGCRDREIVGRGKRHVAALAQHCGQFVDGCGHAAFARLHEKRFSWVCGNILRMVK